jgi:hypothetical protein
MNKYMELIEDELAFPSSTPIPSDCLQTAMKTEDPSLARGVYLDKDLKWLCEDCPYLNECEKIRAAGAAA